MYADQGFTPSFVGGLMFHPRTMICFHAVPTFRNAADNQRTRKLFEALVRGCAERGWPIYRIHPRVPAARHADVRLQRRRAAPVARDAEGCDRSERHRVAGALRHLAEAVARAASMKRMGVAVLLALAGGAVTRTGRADPGVEPHEGRGRGSRHAGRTRRGRVQQLVQRVSLARPAERTGHELAAVQVPGQPARGARRPYATLTADQVKFYVRNGVAMMAPFRKTEVGDADLDALAAYLTRRALTRYQPRPMRSASSTAVPAMIMPRMSRRQTK